MTSLFIRKKILHSNEEIANRLKAARINNSLKLSYISKKINISTQYLEALENGEFNKLPAGIYGRNFLREYSNFLKLDSQEIMETYDANIINNHTKKGKELFTQRVSGINYFLSLPKIAKNITIVLIVLICVGYLGYYVKNIISPPLLNITEPLDNITTTEKIITINGFTEPEAKVAINGQSIVIEKNGHFSEKINLRVGVNSILISSQKKYSKKNEVVKKILVKE